MRKKTFEHGLLYPVRELASICGEHADPEAPCPAKGYIFREDLPDLPSHS